MPTGDPELTFYAISDVHVELKVGRCWFRGFRLVSHPQRLLQKLQNINKSDHNLAVEKDKVMIQRHIERTVVCRVDSFFCSNMLFSLYVLAFRVDSAYK